MSILKTKRDLKNLLDSPAFVKLLGVDSLQKYMSIPRAEIAEFNEYVEKPWDETAEGVTLFSLPAKNHGSSTTTVHVARLFGQIEKPFRVFGTEWVPWGNEMDPGMTIADFSTLGEAMDSAFHVHDHGRFSINTLDENEHTGHYVKGAPVKELPFSAPAPASTADLARAEKIEEALKVSLEAWAAFDLQVASRQPVGLGDVGFIMRIAHDLGFDALSNPGESAVIMNRVLFKSEGVVQAGLNEFFMMDDEYIGKFAVQVQEPVTGEYFCFGLDGERLTLDDLLNAGVLSETNPEVIAAIKKLSAAPTATDLSTPAVIDFDGEHEAFLISGDTRDFERNERALTQAVAAFNERALEQVVEAKAGTVVKKARPDDESELGM